MSECRLCGKDSGNNHVCPYCLDEVNEGRGPSEHLLCWWSLWGINDAGMFYPIELSATDLVLVQPELRYILDNWTAALRTESVDGPVVKWVHIHEAIKTERGITLWCRRFDPHPGPGDGRSV
ncbi:MAG: hypothetical protein ACWGQW_02570 [bacterium]